MHMPGVKLTPLTNPRRNPYSASLRTVLPACTSSGRAIEVVQRYQLNHSHENANHNEARAENPLAVG